MKKILVVLLILSVFPAFAEEKMAPLVIPATRSLGMGGPHVAYTDDIYALFVNPAALQRVNQISIFEISPAIVNLTNLVKTLGPVTDGDFGNLGDIARDGKIPLGFELRGPLSLGYAANGLGFGVWDRVHMDATIIGTSIEASLLADFIANFGMSFSVINTGSHTFDAGFVVKPFMRAKAGLDVDGLDAVGGDFKILDEFDVPLIFGGGFDLGFMYRFRKSFAAGLTVDDVFTRGGVVTTITGTNSDTIYRVPTTLNMGLAYTLKLRDLWSGTPAILEPTYAAFMFDWHDFTNLFFMDDYTNKNPILNLGFGTEFGFFNFLKVRLGLNEMLPSVGLGLENKAVQFNVAAYGRELGNEPGQLSTWALDLSFAIRLQSKQKTWPWNSRPLVDVDAISAKVRAGKTAQ